TLIKTTTTDANGYYQFTTLPAGDYYLTFTAPNGYVFSPKDATVDTLDSDANSAGQTDVFHLDPEQANNDLDAGLYYGATIGDYVWNDVNADGIQGEEEVGMGDVRVDLYSSDNTHIATTTTEGDGYYQFTRLPVGDYYLIFTAPDGYLFSPKDA